MIATYDVTAVLRLGVRKVYETINAEKALVFVVNPDTGAVRVTVAEGCPYAREANLVNEPCAQLAMLALKQRKLQVMNEADLQGLPGAVRREHCNERQAIAVPIMANNNLFGVLEVFEKTNGRPFHRNEVAFVNQVATKLALVIQNTQAYMTINRLNENLEQKVKDRTVALEKAITTLKDTQAQLMQSEKLATIGTLAGGVAHEINNPLAAILANVQLLKIDAEDEDDLESLGMIEHGARRCKEIVENLLNYSRQSGKYHMSLLVNAALDDTLGFLQHHIRLDQITLVKDYRDMPPVLGNANELSQVFTNLIVNALDAIGDAHPDGQSGTLTLRTRVSGKFIHVEVVDDGCGIDDQLQRKIFDPFYTTKQVGKGTGLGLSVSQQILATHGGRIEVESRLGVGSTCRVVLPVAHGAEHGTGPLGPPLL
jgi:signal transduction histidine kinase